MGIMTSYGSYNNSNAPVISNSLIISISNSFVSFLSGFVVWSVIGYLAHIESPVSDEVSSIGLAFIAYPTAAAVMKGATIWNLILFMTIFLLGIDSAFSMVEALSTVVYDYVGDKMSRPKINLILCTFGALCSLIFCLDIGIYIFDVIDHFLNAYMMMLIGILECVGVGWFLEFERVKEKLGTVSCYAYSLGYWGALLISLPITFHVFTGKEHWGVLLWIILTILVWILSYCTRATKNGDRLSF